MSDLRLLMRAPQTDYVRGTYRFVDELTGRPGHCGEDCWHHTPEAAARCYWKPKRKPRQCELIEAGR